MRNKRIVLIHICKWEYFTSEISEDFASFFNQMVDIIEPKRCDRVRNTFRKFLVFNLTHFNQATWNIQHEPAGTNTERVNDPNAISLCVVYGLPCQSQIVPFVRKFWEQTLRQEVINACFF